MTLSFPSPEFSEAVAAVCHGVATETQMRALNVLLRSDPRARDEYLLRLELHTRLASKPDLFPQTAREPADACGFNPYPERVRVVTPVLAMPARRWGWAPALALAACLALGAVGVWSVWFRGPARNRATSAAVAMLTRAVDARWDPSTPPPRAGSALAPGWLRLEAGMAQVVFYSGARVVLEGPAQLRIVSANEAVCPVGRLLAEVPQPARGFRLRTDQLNLVDLGTAFGVDASRGRTEVHVFKGKVEVLPQAATKQSLDAGQATAVQGRTAPRAMAANEDAFAPMFEFQQRSLALEAFHYERWQLASARLNLDPSLVVHLDFQNLSGSDWTLPNTVEKNRTAPDATIVGCQRAEGRWREKQALEFQSVNDRVRLAVPGEYDALTLAAWVCVKGLDREFNSLFMCDGFEPGTVHWLIRNDGVLGLTVFGPRLGNFQILASPPVVPLDKLGMWLHLAVVLDGKTGQVIHYVNGSPVARLGLKVRPPYRVGAAELGNWNALSGPNPAPGLIRNLSGAIDEFELFGRALGEGELLQLYLHGNP